MRGIGPFIFVFLFSNSNFRVPRPFLGSIPEGVLNDSQSKKQLLKSLRK